MLAVNGYTHIVGRYPFIIGSEIIGTPKGLFIVDRFRCYMDRYSIDDQIGHYFRVYGLPILQISRADSGVVDSCTHTVRTAKSNEQLMI